MSNSIMYEIEMNSFNSGESEKNGFGEFLALGLFDGISINKFLIDKDSNETNSGLMPVIDQYYKNRIKFEKNNTLFKNQTFLIFKNYINDENKKNIENFMNSTDWNFQFITFSYINTKSNKLKFTEKFATYLELEKSKKICIFDTLDNCSFISIVKAKSYREGLDILLQLGFEQFNNYCFSLATLNSEYHECEEEHVSIKINMIVKNYNELKKLENEIKPTNKGYNLGNTDAFVTYENITVSELYKLFTNEGPFNNQKKDLLNATFSINTHITNTVKNNFNSYTPEIINNTEIKKIILEGFHKKIAEIKYSNSIGNEFIYHLYGVIDVLRQVVNYDCCEFPFLSIYPSLKILIKELNNVDFTNASGLSLDQYYIYLNVVKKVIELVTNSSYHTHHDAISNIESNQICGKIITFYNIFVYKMVKAFTSENIEFYDKHDYGFLIAPQLYKKTEIRVLNNSPKPKDRLLIVNIPINQIYNISNVLISLVHECGHFIGDNIRNREFRLIKVNEIIAYYCSEIVFYHSCKISSNDDEKEVCNFIKSYFWIVVHKLLEQLTGDRMKDYSYLSIYESEIRDNLTDYIIHHKVEMISDLKHLFEKSVFNKDTNPSYEPADPEQYLKLVDLIGKFTDFISTNYDILFRDSNDSLKVITFTVFTILRECFADLFAIVILNLNYSEYLEAFFNSNYGVEETIYKKQFYTRAALVCHVMGWSEKNIDEKFVKIKEYAKQIDEQIYYISTGGMENSKRRHYIVKPFHMQYVWEATVEYLKECNESLNKTIKNEKKDLLKNAQSIYDKINCLFRGDIEEQNYNIDEVMDLINYYIYSFETEIETWR